MEELKVYIWREINLRNGARDLVVMAITCSLDKAREKASEKLEWLSQYNGYSGLEDTVEYGGRPDEVHQAKGYTVVMDW